MKRIVGTLLNFFFPGAGYLVASRDPKKKLLGIPFLIGIIGLTYVELSIKPLDEQLYWIMFASVFIMNTAFAIDIWREAAPTD